MKHPHEMTDQDRIHDLEETVSRLEAERQPLIREVAALACESVKRDGALAKLEAEVIASRNIVRIATQRTEEAKADYRREHQRAQDALGCRDHWRDRAKELERLVREYREAQIRRQIMTADAPDYDNAQADVVNAEVELFAAVPETSNG